jgi:hypothetical protein
MAQRVDLLLGIIGCYSFQIALQILFELFAVKWFIQLRWIEQFVLH